MYSEKQEQIRLALTQFFGSMVMSSQYKEPERKRQSVTALTIEELLKLCKTQEGNMDMIAAKPIIKATHYILECRMAEITKELSEKGIDDEIIGDSIADIEWIVNDLKKYLDTIQ